MNWNQLLSGKRFGMEEYHERKHERTDFQRDYDRLIFSSPFRRLQNKTQVFPLPGSIFVHNRLTHSLEVSCVGRSLGNNVAKGLMLKYPDGSVNFPEIGSIVSAACLAHDMGNPPFGHSGERAISAYFAEGNGKKLQEKILNEGGRYEDFLHFEGNANAMRLLTQDLKWAGFWGDYTGSPMTKDLGITLSSGTTVAKDCLDDLDRGSFPTSTGSLRSFWVAHIDGNRTVIGGGLDCIDVGDRIANSDVVSIKRLVGNSLESKDLVTTRFYLATTTQSAYLFKKGEAIPGTMINPQLWEYQHFIYYLSPNSKNGNPELRKRYLTPGGGSLLIGGAMAEGIEQMRILLGVDDSLVPDGEIDRYVATNNVTGQEWSEGRVIAARVFVLVRSLQVSSRYVNNNTYQVGDIQVPGNGDGYRRLLLESSVSLRNPAVIAGGGK